MKEYTTGLCFQSLTLADDDSSGYVSYDYNVMLLNGAPCEAGMQLREREKNSQDARNTISDAVAEQPDITEEG